MYIRPKKKGKNSYAILVECRRVRGRGRPRKKIKGISHASRPKEFVIEHLGRIISPEKKDAELGAKESIIENTGENSREIITNLVVKELFRHDFSRTKDSMKYKDAMVDLKNLYIYRLCSTKQTKPIVIQLNEGFMCDYTLKNLLNFKPKEDEDSEKTKLRFAKAYLEAGLTMNESFTKLFGLLTAKEEKEQTADYIKNVMPELAELRKKQNIFR